MRADKSPRSIVEEEGAEDGGCGCGCWCDDSIFNGISMVSSVCVSSRRDLRAGDREARKEYAALVGDGAVNGNPEVEEAALGGDGAEDGLCLAGDGAAAGGAG